MSDDEKNDYKLMQAVAQYTKITPKERLEESRQLVKKLKNSEMYKIEETETRVDGHIL